MPEALADWGCDAGIWKLMPPGARRDLTRFGLTGAEELGRNRITTMKEIAAIAYNGQDTWEKEVWEKGVATWEAEATAKLEAEKKAAKEAKRAAAKAKREAEAAAKAA